VGESNLKEGCKEEREDLKRVEAFFSEEREEIPARQEPPRMRLPR
jgi:hypothetical protein